MSTSDLSYRYAKAIFSAAALSDLEQKVDEDLTDYVDLMKSVPELSSALNNPLITAEIKEQILIKCLLVPLSIKFILLVISHKRLAFLPEIARSYHDQLLAKQEIIEARLVTPYPPPAPLLTRLQDRLQHTYNKPFVLRSEVDPHLIGGAMLFVDNRMLDYSLRGRLDSIKHALQVRGHAH